MITWDEKDQLTLARDLAREATKAASDEQLARHAFRSGLHRLSQALNVPATGTLTPDQYPDDPIVAAQHIVDNLLPTLSRLAAERRHRAALLRNAGHLCAAAAEAAEQAAPKRSQK